MRLLFVVQRYGHEVAGGAEAACRDVATRLAARGHEVRVLTTCARSYTTWADEYPPGEEELDGVVVERLPVRHPRDLELFARADARLDGLGNRANDSLQRSWAWLQGPDVPALPAAIQHHAAHHDVAVFFTYLYATTRVGLAAAAGRIPTALVPCAHAEPPLRWRINRRTFELADRRLFLTPEEAELVTGCFPSRAPAHTVGLGTDVGLARPSAASISAFRAEHGLGDRPYLVSVGRIDPNKGSDWLADVHVAWRRLPRRPDIPLVFVGDPVFPLPPARDLVVTGFVSADAREAAIAGSLALVHPSPYESFGSRSSRHGGCTDRCSCTPTPRCSPARSAGAGAGSPSTTWPATTWRSRRWPAAPVSPTTSVLSVRTSSTGSTAGSRCSTGGSGRSPPIGRSETPVRSGPSRVGPGRAGHRLPATSTR